MPHPNSVFDVFRASSLNIHGNLNNENLRIIRYNCVIYGILLPFGQSKGGFSKHVYHSACQ